MTTKPKISILCPTRGRPRSVDQLIRSVANTAALPTELIFYVDEDDRGSYLSRDNINYLSFSPHPNVEVRFLVGPRIVLSECWNRCADVAVADVLMQCGDDIRFRADAWDADVLDEFERCPDKILLVHGRDGIQDERVATHGFLHRRWVDATGYLVPPYFASDYNDLWLTEVADALGRRVYLPDVYTEHLHPAAGKAPLDRTHEERLARHRADDCDAIWRRTAPERAADVEKLRAAIAAHTADGVTA